jgi:hypothetical protein
MNKKEWKEYMEIKGWPKSFEVNPWGSCQYDNMYRTFKLYFKVKKDLSLVITPRKLHIELLDVFNITLNSKFEYVGFHNVRNCLLLTILQETSMSLSVKDFNYVKKCIDCAIEITNHATTVDYLIGKTRELSWSLWKTIPTVFDSCFINLDMDISKVPACEGIGPIGNQAIQRENYLYGIMAALLVDLNIVKNEKCFTKFDT